MKYALQKAFTLVELLIVIGIIGILAVTFLVTLNPAEAQRKARDATRLKDMQTLQVFAEQWISDGLNPLSSPNWTAATGVPSTNNGGLQGCNDNWIGGTNANVCTYLRTVPRDPSNGQNRAIQPSGSQIMFYRFRMTAGEYEINSRLESASNLQKLSQDGGNNDAWYEIGTNLGLMN